MKKLSIFLFLFAGLLLSFKAISLPLLNSLPAAKSTIFLDFDGHFVYASSWNSGQPLSCAPANLTDAQVTEVFHRVSEDFRPFEINITTDSAVFLATPLTRRIRIIVTPTSAWFPNAGGVSYTGSFTWGDDTPGFVFTDKLGNKPKLIAECCSHESGHTLGLSHQAKYSGTCTLLATYNDGIGSGETGWAPVMGNSYYKNFSGWNNGPTPSGCTADQDNLSIITSLNGFTYRPDDHADDPALSATILASNITSFSSSGIISTNVDKDIFKLTVSKVSSLRINAVPFSVGPNNDGADLDIKLTLLDSNAQVVKIFDDPSSLDATINTNVVAGIYYLVAEGAGNANTSNYGSLGSYTISGIATPLTITPIKQVLLSGKSNNSSHNLSWNIIADEPLKNISLESSHDGTIFTTLKSFSSNPNQFSYNPQEKVNIFYRLKVNSVTGELVYSNIVSLSATNNPAKDFKVSTLTHDNILVIASKAFEFKIADMSGRIITSGKGTTGLNTINFNNYPNGIYTISIISNNQRTTERIVRM